LVQTPTDLTGSQGTDPEEIYDSVRSLGKGLDESLLQKKVQARLIQELAAREMIEQENEDLKKVQNVSAARQVYSDYELDLNSSDEEIGAAECQRHSALRQMLQHSETFLAQQRSSSLENGRLPAVQAQDSSHQEEDSFSDELLRRSSYE